VNAATPEAIEQALCQIKGVEAARVCMEQGAIVEVHIAAGPGTRPKHIARDVRSYLAAALGIEVDHKKISIALRKPADPPVEDATAAGRNGRLRLDSLALDLRADAAVAQVRLSFDGRVLQGASRGSPTEQGVERAVLAATLEALQQIVRREIRLTAGEMRRLRIGAREATLVQVIVWRPHEEQHLLGSCWVRRDPYRPVVLATLDAVNRTLCRLAPIQWMEIRVEPGAAGDESEETP
jgi:hypothetical protein